MSPIVGFVVITVAEHKPESTVCATSEGQIILGLITVKVAL